MVCNVLFSVFQELCKNSKIVLTVLDSVGLLCFLFLHCFVSMFV